MKICANCRHYEGMSLIFEFEHICHRKKEGAPTDMVSGEPKYDLLTCERQRRAPTYWHPDRCGPDGVYFAPAQEEGAAEEDLAP